MESSTITPTTASATSAFRSDSQLVIASYAIKKSPGSGWFDVRIRCKVLDDRGALVKLRNRDAPELMRRVAVELEVRDLERRHGR